MYDKGVNITNGDGVYDLLVSYRSGDVWAPKVSTSAEALERRVGVLPGLHPQAIATPRERWHGGPARRPSCWRQPDRSLKERGRLVSL